MIRAYIPENLIVPGIEPILINHEIKRKPDQEEWVCVIQKETLAEYEESVTELLNILTENFGEQVANTSVVQVND